MSNIDLERQLRLIIGRAQVAINQLEHNHPLKPWFQLELRMLMPPDVNVRMEELSARMRAARQLQFMVLDNSVPANSVSNAEESYYTQMSRVPGALLETVRQTNFSIEPELLYRDTTGDGLFDLVSPTAKVVSYLRDQHARLTFAETLSCRFEAQAILRQLEIDDVALQAKLSLLFQARYFTINSAIATCQTTQVLEVASGISPRGLQWSRENPGTVYVESDLPALMRKKAKALRNAIQQDNVATRGVLHCCGVNALELSSLQHALEYTDPKTGLVIVTEGLLLYFSNQETQQFLQHMKCVLSERRNAFWVVDLVSRKNLQELLDGDPAVAAAVRKVFASTSRNVVETNPFADEGCILAALRVNGLRVQAQTALGEWHGQDRVLLNGLTSDIKAICGSRKIWTITAA